MPTKTTSQPQVDSYIFSKRVVSGLFAACLYLTTYSLALAEPKSASEPVKANTSINQTKSVKKGHPRHPDRSYSPFNPEVIAAVTKEINALLEELRKLGPETAESAKDRIDLLDRLGAKSTEILDHKNAAKYYGQELNLKIKYHYDLKSRCLTYFAWCHYLTFADQYAEAQKQMLILMKWVRMLPLKQQGGFLAGISSDLDLCAQNGQDVLVQIPIYREALSHFLIDDLWRIQIMRHLAWCYLCSGKLWDSAMLYLAAFKRQYELEHLPKGSSLGHEDAWIRVYLDQTRHASELNGIDSLRNLCQFRKNTYGDNDYSVIGTYRAIGDCCQPDTIAARNYYKEALDRASKVPHDDDYWYTSLVKLCEKHD